jgi:hypothetical protein
MKIQRGLTFSPSTISQTKPDSKLRESSCRAFGFFLAIGFAICSFSAVAAKPEGAGHGQVKVQGQGQGKGKEDKDGRPGKWPGGGQDARSSGGGGKQISVSIGGYFQPQQRAAVQAYYGPIVQSGRCPPGLAKKNNGCMPPGQAKGYALGRPLPPQLVFHEVPSVVSVQIGLPPAGHRYVRVAADILLIAIGTGMVVDAIEDLGRL